MNKLIGISIIHVLFCTFMMNFIRSTFFYDNWHIVYTFVIYSISAVFLFIYQRWINKKVLPFFTKNKHRYDTMSLALSYTIVGVIISRILTIINFFTYFIKITKQIMTYADDITSWGFATILFHMLIFVIISAMTMQGLLDIRIHNIRRLRWNDK